MTRLEIQTLIAARLGSRTDLNAEIQTYLTLVQQTVLEQDKDFLPWFLLNPRYTFAVSTGVNSVNLPSGWLREVDEESVFIYPTATPTRGNTSVIRKVIVDAIPVLSDDTAAVPTVYSVVGNKILFDTTTDKDYTILLNAYLRDALLTADGVSNFWSTEGADWLIAETLLKLADRLQNDRLLKSAALLSNEAKTRLKGFTEARIHAGMTYQMGVSVVE